MAPELAVAYVVGWVPSCFVTGLHFYSHRKKVRSESYQQLQRNLHKVGLSWREAHSNIEEFKEGKEDHDLRNYEKNLLLMGAAFFLLSWAGVIFNLIVFFSVHSWAVSRKERQIFSSDLTSKELSPDQVQGILKELSSYN